MKPAVNWSGWLTCSPSTEPVTEMADAAMSSPTSSAPASPMNSFAGWKFSGSSPMHAPIRMAVVSDARLKYGVCASACSM